MGIGNILCVCDYAPREVLTGVEVPTCRLAERLRSHDSREAKGGSNRQVAQRPTIGAVFAAPPNGVSPQLASTVRNSP